MVDFPAPYTSRFLDLDGLRMHYLDEGAGEPIVMIHGNPSWSIYYRHLVKGLRENYRTIVPDHIGCGLSDKPADSQYEYTLERRVEDLERLLEHLGVKENITLVVHDWGGMIGMAFAVRHPKRIRRLVVTNTGAFHLPAGKPFPLALKIIRDTQLGPFLVQGFNAFAVGAAMVGCKMKPMSQELKKAYCAPYDSWQNRVATLRFVQDIPLKPGDRSFDMVTKVSKGLGQLREIPMMMIWGEKDFVFDGHFLGEWRRRFPHAEVHAYRDAGHYILEELGGDAVPLVTKFLEAHPLTERS